MTLLCLRTCVRTCMCVWASPARCAGAPSCQLHTTVSIGSLESPVIGCRSSLLEQGQHNVNLGRPYIWLACRWHQTSRSRSKEADQQHSCVLLQHVICHHAAEQPGCTPGCMQCGKPADLLPCLLKYYKFRCFCCFSFSCVAALLGVSEGLRNQLSKERLPNVDRICSSLQEAQLTLIASHQRNRVSQAHVKCDKARSSNLQQQLALAHQPAIARQ